MNIIEAVSTSKPIKRKSWFDYLTIQKCDCKITRFRPHSECPEASLMFPEYVDPKLTPEDILAEDWETKTEHL